MSEPRIPPIVHEVLRSPGQPLAEDVRAFYEPRFRHDFSRVRVHADGRAADSARAVGALAYTVGQDVVFGADRYDPASRAGRRLLAHELTHVVQQRQANADVQRLAADTSTDSAQEAEARRNGERVAAGQSVSVAVSAGPAVLYRQIGEPAGGCGVCWRDPRKVGDQAHLAIELEIELEYGAAHPQSLHPEFPLLSALGNAKPDVLLATPTGVAIAEIKPANPKGLEDGRKQLARDTRIFRSLFPKATIEYLTLPVLPTIFPNPNVEDPECALQTLHTRVVEPGLYQYFCVPPWSQLKTRCKCKKRREAEEAQKQAQAVALPVVTELYPELQQYRDAVNGQLRRERRVVAVGESLAIIVPRAAYIRLVGEPRMEKTLELIRFHGLDPRRNPVIGYHNLWVTLVGYYAAAEATVVAAPIALEGLGAGAAAASGETLAEVIPLFAEAAETVAKAAAVVLVVWVGARASEAKAFTTKQVDAVLAVPVAELAARGEGGALRLGSDVDYQGANYVVVGFAGARPRGAAPPAPAPGK